MKKLFIFLTFFVITLLSSCNKQNISITSFAAQIYSFGTNNQVSQEKIIYITENDQRYFKVKLELKKESKAKVKGIEFKCDEETIEINSKKISKDGTVIDIDSYDSEFEFEVFHRLTTATLKIESINCDDKWNKNLSNNELKIVLLSKDTIDATFDKNTIDFKINNNEVRNVSYETLYKSNIKSNIYNNKIVFETEEKYLEYSYSQLKITFELEYGNYYVILKYEEVYFKDKDFSKAYFDGDILIVPDIETYTYMYQWTGNMEVYREEITY